MRNRGTVCSVLALSMLALPLSASQGATLSPSSSGARQGSAAELVQYWGRGPGWGWGGGPRWAGRPYWYARPWVRRPYYGTIIAGVALGALVTVAIAGRVPPRPAPNLCWYWADPYRNRGYWDYCY